MRQQKRRQIAIDDIKLAAYLHAKQIPIERVQRSGRYGCFYFDEKKARAEVDRYVLGEALVEPKVFSAAIRELRSLVDSLSDEISREFTAQTDGKAS